MEGTTNLAILTAPFPQSAIKSRAGGGGKQLSYVETHTVIHRLNAATGNCWNFSILRESMEGNLLVCHGELTLPGLGSRQAIGVQLITEKGGEDLRKGAASDSIKKCSTLFGVGLELYGPDYGAVNEEAMARDAALDLNREQKKFVAESRRLGKAVRNEAEAIKFLVEIMNFNDCRIDLKAKADSFTAQDWANGTGWMKAYVDLDRVIAESADEAPPLTSPFTDEEEAAAEANAAARGVV